MGRKITKNTIRSLPYKAEVNCWKCVLLFWSKGESVVAITIRHLIDYKVILTLTTRSFSPIPIFTYIGDGFPDRTRVQVNCVHRRINCWWCKKHQFVNLNIKSRDLESLEMEDKRKRGGSKLRWGDKIEKDLREKGWRKLWHGRGGKDKTTQHQPPKKIG